MKILNTRNYRLFTGSGENRPLDIKKHRKLEDSMKKHGFLLEFPIIAFREGNGNLIVKDGQHRLAIAEKLGLVVYYVESKTDFDVAEINTTPIGWIPADYAQKHAANGLKPYEEGLAFAEQHNLPVGIAFALLAGTTGYTNIKEQFISGAFKVKDRAWADAVAGIYAPLVALSKEVKGVAMIEACMAVSRASDFDPRRLLRGANNCREKLVSYSTRDANLEMLEEIYNFRRQQLVPLKINAITAMRERNAVSLRKAQSAAKRQNGK